MKTNYALKFLSVFMLLFSFSSLEAQDLEKGVLRFKLKETKSEFIKQATISKSSTGVVKIGNSKFDKALEQCKAYDIKRVFRESGKFEAKHKKYGLHLWYEITFDQKLNVNEVLKSFNTIEEIQTLEPVHKKMIIDGKPSPVTNTTKASLNTDANDEFYDFQWHYENTGNNSGRGGNGTADADIDLPEAWEIQTGSPDVIVAVIDGGVDVNHQDLVNNIWINTDEIPGNGRDDDNNGYVDDVNGYNFGDNTSTPNASDHGTHVAGTVGATTNNSTGVAGVAGGNGSGDGARLMSCAVFGDVGTTGFDTAFIYAADNGAVIAQNSWGYTSPGVVDQSVLDAIDYFIAEAGYDANGNPTGPMQGGIVIFAAGNDGTDDEWFPGFYEPVMAVAATDLNDNLSSFSNRGSWVDIAAPGSDIVSTFPDNGYSYNSGTSMACPHVSGVAALIVSEFAGNITPDEVWSRLVDNTDPISASNAGSGRLNAFNSLNAAGNDPVFPDPNKTYYIDNKQWNVRLGANGTEDAFATSTSTTGDNVEWTITESPTEGYYYIDCVGGGNAPRIRTDLSSLADMQATSSAGTWTRWMFTDVGDGYFYLTTLRQSDFMRLQVDGGNNVRTVATNFTGSWTHFTFTEAGNRAAVSSLDEASIATSGLEKPLALSVYPNPAIDYLNISNVDNITYTKAEILDISGNPIRKINLSDSPDKRIDVNGISTGVYMLRLTTSDGTTSIVKFLK